MSCASRDVPRLSTLSEGCLLNSDCQSPLVCVFRRCHQPCNERRDCPAGADCQPTGDPPQLVCLQLTCATGPCPEEQICGADRQCRRRCENAAHCDPRQACVHEQCVWSDQLQPDGGFAPPFGVTLASPDAGCEYTSQCSAGQRCLRSGACGPECLTAADCAGGAACDGSGRCVPVSTDAGVTDSGVGPGDAGCQYTSQCGAAEICGVRGQCIPACLTSRDCDFGFVCSAQRGCEPVFFDGGAVDSGSPPAGCVYSTQCDAGLRCGPSGACQAECLGNRDCAPGDECRASVCIPALGDAGLPDGGVPLGWGSPCVVSSQCASGLTCDARGRCTYECVTSRDCATSTSGTCCAANRCQPAAVCAVPLSDAGTRDAGTVGLDGGCAADIDCIDNDFCNGTEVCRAGRCLPGVSPCFDNNPCTNDVCLAATRQCTYQTIAVDGDGDGHYPLTCPRDAGAPADDCDDADPTTYLGAPERCDLKDNNCNGVADELLWRERPGARGFVTAGQDYFPSGGPPVVARSGSELVLVAASHHVRGTHEAFRIDGTTLSSIAGPVQLLSAGSPWATCSSSVTRYGTQAVQPQLFAIDGGLVMTGLTARFTQPQATCCGPAEVRRLEARAVELAPDLTIQRTTLLAAGNDPGTNDRCRDYTGIAFSVASGTAGYSPFSRVAAARSEALGSLIYTWWDNLSPGGAMGLRFAVTTDAGVLGPRRDVYGGVSAAVDAVPVRATAADQGMTGPGVAVGSRSVLFVWTNDNLQPFAVPYVRWILYDPNLSQPIAGPFGYALPGSTTGTSPTIDNVTFDGREYVLHVSGWATVALASRFLRIDEDGQLVSASRAYSTNPITGNFPTEYGWGAVTAFGSTLWPGGYADTAQSGNAVRLTFSGAAPTSPLITVDVDLAQPYTSRSDFAVARLSDGAFGLFWTDGYLRKTAVECTP